MPNPSRRKQGSGWYPPFTRRSRKPSVAHDHHWRHDMEGKPGEDWAPQQPHRRRARRADHEITSWEHCFNDNCKEHRWEKVDAGYYPRQVGEKGELSKKNRTEHKKERAVRKWLGGERSENTIPDVEAREKTISDLRRQLDCAAQTIVAKDNNLERLDKERRNSNKPTIDANRGCTKSGECCGRKESSIVGPMQEGEGS